MPEPNQPPAENRPGFNVRQTTPFIILLLLIFLGGYLLVSAYSEVLRKTIRELNERQYIHARQAARSIENFMQQYIIQMDHLAEHRDIQELDEAGKTHLQRFFDRHSPEIRAITRLDAAGRVMHTVPFDLSSIGKDLSYQKHVAAILASRQPVISDIFQAFQGIRAIAIHVPVFKENQFAGTIGIIFSAEDLAKQFLREIRIGSDGYAWLISREGVELYCPVPGHIGKTVGETSGRFPSVMAMAEKMMRGEEGTTIYSYDKIRGKNIEVVTKHAVYMPVRIGRTFWSIVVATPETDVMASMEGFRDRILIVVLLLGAGLVAIAVNWVKRRERIRDAAQQRAADMRLRESEQRFRLLAESAPLGIGIVEGEKIVYLNPEFTRISGFRQADLPDLAAWFAKAYPDDEARQKAGANWRRIQGSLRQTGEPVQTMVNMCCADGSVKNIRFASILMSVDQYMFTLDDVTRQIQSEEKIRQGEKKLREILDYTTNLFYSRNPEHHFTYVSPQSRLFLGCEPESALVDWREFITGHPLNRPGLENANRALWEGNPQPPYLLELKGRDDRLRWVEVREAPVMENGRVVAVVGSFSDVTGKVNFERDLQRIDRLESLGVLAGGIAHDFNNILVGILGNISLASLELPPEDGLRRYLADAEQACRRAKELAGQLLAFSRGGKPLKMPVAIEKLLLESASFAMSGSRTRCVVEADSGLPLVEADEGQISQVMNNLLLNANQAMPEGGLITVRADGAVLTGQEQLGLPAGEYVRVSVQDEGYGIAEEDLPRIFDPYFSTKPEGAGLGLTTVHAIIRNHGGAVQVESSPAKGAIFRFYLPVSAVEPAPVCSVPPLPAGKGRGRVLILDDDKMVGEVLSEMLRVLGYRPEVTRDGRDTVAVYRQAVEAGEPFLAVIADLTIPGGTGGRETLKLLQEIDPGVVAIASSGYSDDPILANCREWGFAGVLVKPYRVEEVGSQLQKLQAEIKVAEPLETGSDLPGDAGWSDTQSI